MPGSRFEQVFHPSELRLAQRKGKLRAQHLAGRWAAKEAFVKAWSQALYGRAPLLSPEQLNWAEIQVCPDAWGRVHIQLGGVVEKLCDVEVASLSITHDGDYAQAACLVTRRV